VIENNQVAVLSEPLTGLHDTGSIPVSRTDVLAGQRVFWSLCHLGVPPRGGLLWQCCSKRSVKPRPSVTG